MNSIAAVEISSGTTQFVRRKPTRDQSVSTSELGREVLHPVLLWGVASDAETKKASAATADLSQQEFNIVISRISRLLQEEDDFRPTEYALLTALTMVYEANEILRGRFPRAAVAVDEDGSIVIYWKRPERNIHLTIPARRDGVLYIYHRE